MCSNFYFPAFWCHFYTHLISKLVAQPIGTLPCVPPFAPSLHAPDDLYSVTFCCSFDEFKNIVQTGLLNSNHGLLAQQRFLHNQTILNKNH